MKMPHAVGSLVATLLVVVLVALVGTSAAAGPEDEVTNLPYLTQTPPFKHYSGYLTLGTKQFHYWFMESENNPNTDPLILWVCTSPPIPIASPLLPWLVWTWIGLELRLNRTWIGTQLDLDWDSIGLG